MSELAGLIERCERATGEEQGDLLTEAVHLLCPTETAEPFSEELAGIIRIHALIYAAGHTDAALALVERKLPGMWQQILQRAMIDGDPMDWHPPPDTPLEKLPVNIILALLRSLDAAP